MTTVILDCKGGPPAGPDNCLPGSNCDCGPATPPAQNLSWAKTLFLTSAGAALCLLLVQLLGA
jgi:hypothetical protein